MGIQRNEFSDSYGFWEPFSRYLGEAAAQTARVAARTLGVTGGSILEETAAGGDLQTRSDEEAGVFLREFLSRSRVPLALLDERTGRMQPLHDNPVVGIIADELDGTRPARMGVPACCVSLAAYPLDGMATLGNVRAGVIFRLDTQTEYRFVRNGGIWRARELYGPGKPHVPFNSACVYIDDGMTHPALHGAYVQDFMPHIRHGVLRLCSLCYGGALMVDGGLDILLHLSYREYEAWPSVQPIIDRVWHGMKAPFSYDVAALVPLLWQCGYTVSDAFGGPLSPVHLINTDDASATEVPGIVAARDQKLYSEVMRVLNRRERYLLDVSQAVAAACDMPPSF